MKRQKTEKGFTFLELLISFAIFSAVIVSSAYVIITSQHLSEESRNKLTALNAARSTLETVKNTPLANVPNINTSALVPSNLPNGKITITTNPANVQTAQIATVTVNVSWTGPRNSARALAMTTMRSRF